MKMHDEEYKDCSLTDKYTHEHDHARRWSSSDVPREDYLAMTLLNSSQTSNTSQRTV